MVLQVLEHSFDCWHHLILKHNQNERKRKKKRRRKKEKKRKKGVRWGRGGGRGARTYVWSVCCLNRVWVRISNKRTHGRTANSMGATTTTMVMIILMTGRFKRMFVMQWHIHRACNIVIRLQSVCLWVSPNVHTHTYSPLCFQYSQPPDPSHLDSTLDSRAFFCLRTLYMAWPSLSSPKETLSGLLQIQTQNISLSKAIDPPYFPSLIVVSFRLSP